MTKTRILIVLLFINTLSAIALAAPDSKNFVPVDAVTFSPDGKIFASGHRHGVINLWDAQTARLKKTLKGQSGSVTSLAFSPNGKLLANGSPATLNLWDTRTGKLLRRLRIQFAYPTYEFYSVAFSPDSKTLATGSGGNDGKPFEVRLWDASSGKLLRIFGRHKGQIPSVAFSPTGKLLASASYDGTIKLWSVQTGRLITTWRSGAGRFAVAFSPDGQTLANSDNSNQVELRDIRTGKLLFTLSGHKAPVRSVAFTPDAKTLIGGSNDGTIRMWDTQMGQLKRTLAVKGKAPETKQEIFATQFEPRDDVMSVAVSPDGSMLGSGNYDGTVKLQRIEPQQAVE